MKADPVLPRLLAASLLIFLSACKEPEGRLIAADYACDNGRRIHVVFDTKRQTAKVTTEGARDLLMATTKAASGFNYANGRRELMGKGDEAWWIVDGKIETKCAS